MSQSCGIQADYSQTPIGDQEYYRGMTSVTVQRWISDGQRNLFCGMIKPLMDNSCGWAVYEIDDMMFDGTFTGTGEEKKALEAKYGDLRNYSIPLFNRGRKAFEGEAVQRNIRQMLNAADFVTVTTDYLKQVYHDFYGVPLRNIVAFPNFLPKWWIGDRYRPGDKLEQFKANKARPRVGIISSLSHYNVDGTRSDGEGHACRRVGRPDGSFSWVNEAGEEVPEERTQEIADDIDAIVDCIRRTAREFQWVFLGYCPPKLKDLADAGVVEAHGGTFLTNYPSAIDNLRLQAIVAPINPIGFNFCKSFIKYMECSALGVPCFATRCLPYDRVMPDRQLFSGGEELEEKLRKLKFASAGAYQDMLGSQWKWLTSKHREGDFDCNGFFLEDNMSLFVDRFRLRQKTIPVLFSKFVQKYAERKAQQARDVIFKNDNILITK